MTTTWPSTLRLTSRPASPDEAPSVQVRTGGEFAVDGLPGFRDAGTPALQADGGPAFSCAISACRATGTGLPASPASGTAPR